VTTFLIPLLFAIIFLVAGVALLYFRSQVVDRFERGTGGVGSSISLGGATINLVGGERTLGYRYTESILPVATPVYVLGTVRSGFRRERRGSGSSSATAPRRRWGRASARPSSGWAWEA
jgi:hypothetical protein